MSDRKTAFRFTDSAFGLIVERFDPTIVGDKFAFHLGVSDCFPGLAILWPLIRLRGQPLASVTRLNPTVTNILEFHLLVSISG